jgi:hypothetical protein
MLPTKFRFIWPNGFRGEESKKSANQKQESPVAAIFVTDRDRMSNLYRGPSIQCRCFLPSFVSFGQAVSEEKIFRNRPIRNKNCLWWPCLYMDRDEISTLYSGCFLPSFGSFGQAVSEEKICIEINAFWIQISIFKQELSFFSQKIF